MLASSVHSGSGAGGTTHTRGAGRGESIFTEISRLWRSHSQHGRWAHEETAFVQEPFKRKSPFLLQCLCRAHCWCQATGKKHSISRVHLGLIFVEQVMMDGVACLSNPHPELEYTDSDLGPTPYCVNLEMLVNLSRLQFVICKLGIKGTTVEANFIQYNPVCLAVC